jgi:hypothetical protein
MSSEHIRTYQIEGLARNRRTVSWFLGERGTAWPICFTLDGPAANRMTSPARFIGATPELIGCRTTSMGCTVSMPYTISIAVCHRRVHRCSHVRRAGQLRDRGEVVLVAHGPGKADEFRIALSLKWIWCAGSVPCIVERRRGPRIWRCCGARRCHAGLMVWQPCCPPRSNLNSGRDSSDGARRRRAQ